MLGAIRGMLSSKKFIAALVAIVVYVGGRFGLDLDPAAVGHAFLALLAYVGAQGIADVGKEAARVNQQAATGATKTTSTTATQPSSPAS